MLRGSIHRKGWKDMAYILSLLLVLTVAAVVVVAFARTAFAAQGMVPTTSTMVKGEVTEVSSGHHLGMVTMRSSEIGPFPNNTLNIFIVPGTHVKICNATEPAGRLAVGTTATINYHEVSGLAVANSISERC
jgi:hypothetical protein